MKGVKIRRAPGEVIIADSVLRDVRFHYRLRSGKPFFRKRAKRMAGK